MANQLTLTEQARIIEESIDKGTITLDLVDAPSYKGIKFYDKEYQGNHTFYAQLFPTEATTKRSGIRAFSKSGNDWYVFPIYNSPVDIDEMKSNYEKCLFLEAFATTKEEKKDLKASLGNLSTIFGYRGVLKITENQPGPKLKKSWKLIQPRMEKETAPTSETRDFTSALLDYKWSK